MAEFSYSNDIAPLRGNYLPSSLTQRESMGLSAQYGTALDQELERTMKFGNMMDAKRNSDLRYQMNLEILQRSRENAAKEQEMYSKLPTFFDGIKETMSNPELSPVDKIAQMAQVGMNYPMLLSTNHAAATMLSSATRYADMQARQQASQQAAAIKAAEQEQTRSTSQVKSAIPDYDKIITDIRKMSDKLEPTGGTPLGGKSIGSGTTQNLTAADKVVARNYAKSYLQYTDQDFDELYNSQGEHGALLSILGTLIKNRGVMASNLRGVNVVPKGTYDDPNKYKSSSPR